MSEEEKTFKFQSSIHISNYNKITKQIMKQSFIIKKTMKQMKNCSYNERQHYEVSIAMATRKQKEQVAKLQLESQKYIEIQKNKIKELKSSNHVDLLKFMLEYEDLIKKEDERMEVARNLIEQK